MDVINNKIDCLKVILITGLFLMLISLVQAVPDVEKCSYKWSCTEWSRCVNRNRTRICTNIGTCPGEQGFVKPIVKQRCMPELPAQLFDIKLELEKKIISEPNELTAWVRFESFGTEPTPADLTYTIMDEPGNVVYSETGDIVVYTEEFVIKKFDTLYLELGKYTLDLKIEYANVTEEFRQGFEVGEEKRIWIYYLLGFIALVALFFFLYWWKRKRGKIQEIK